MAMENEKKSALTSRSIIIGILGLIIITTSSLYVAIKMGALPWPTVFVTVLSMAALKKAKGSTMQEINCTHTLMSAGSMVAGAIAFTLPGLWIINPNSTIAISSVLASTIVGAVLGTIFTSIYRKKLIEEEKLPYPIGEASYNTLMTAEKEKSAPYLFSSLSFSCIFTFIRDFFGKIPSVLTIIKGSSIIPALTLYVSPMAISIGAIIGPSLALFWTLGMVFGYYLLTPFSLLFGIFKTMEEASIFRSNLGLGIMIGTGFAVVLKAIISLVKNNKTGERKKEEHNKKEILSFSIILLLALLILILFTEMTLLEAFLTILGAGVASYLSSMLTGQTGINPMEVFSILVLLAIHAITKCGNIASFTIAMTVCVSCGLSGDVMNDFKSGSLVKTEPKDQIKAEAIGGIGGAIIATLAIFIIKDIFVLGSVEMPAPQAKAVASMISGLENPVAFWLGVVIGFVLYLFSLPSSAFGLGMYLGTNITLSVALGSLILFIAKKLKGEIISEKSNLISSGLLGGEGVSGVIIALITMIKG